MTAQELFNWARAYSKRAQAAGKCETCPTMREATKRFRCTMDDIEDVIGDDIKGDHYLGIATAVGVQGVGCADIEPRGEQLIEAY
jgi:hypothetical protein